jgi:HSP20 family protein
MTMPRDTASPHDREAHMKSHVEVSRGEPDEQPSAEGEAERAPDSHPILELRRDIDRLFENFVRDIAPPFRWRGFGFGPFGQVETVFRSADEVLPPADCVETERELIITVELPGVGPDHIEVSLADGMLNVDGEKPRTVDLPEARVHLSERRYGAIRRSFRVPAAVDQDAISAAFEKGVLILTLPKRKDPETAARRVQVVRS